MSFAAVVLIVGAGQLGSRYLQGLSACNVNLLIYVVDPNPNALLVAQDRWNSVLHQVSTFKSVSFHISISECPNQVDLAIVSTTASKRYEVSCLLQQNIQIRYWILEKVLVQSSEELQKLSFVFGSDSRVWVNTPRRMLDWHKLIRANLIHERPLHLLVTGKAWGLACNSIHFLDMFAWFTGEFLISISTHELEKRWIQSKRQGFWEVIGTLEARFSGGSTAIISVEDGNLSDLCYQFELYDSGFIWRIDEANGIAVRSDGFIIPGRLPLQSEVTPLLVDKILRFGECDLPTLQVSSELHLVYLDAMLAHWQSTVDRAATRLPIT